jgi:hypothetical protein
MGNIDFFEASGANEVRIVTSPTYPIKVGLAYAINDYQSAYNGLLGGSDTNTGGTIPNATELHVGTLGGTSARLTGHIQFIRYYKKRLQDAKIQAITQLVSDVDANAYIVSLLSAGATVTPTQQEAINNFIKAEKAASRWTLHKRIYLPIWGVAAANAIDMVSLTSGTFVGNVTHNAGSVSTTAPTGHFLANATPASLGINQADASIWALVASGTHEFSGCGGTSNSRFLVGRVGSLNTAAIPSVTSAISGSVDTQGINMASRIGSDLSLFQRKASGWITPLTSTQADTTALPLFNPSFLGNFNNNGTVTNTRTTVGEYGSYGYGLGMTSVQAEAFSLALKSLFETATGKTLP